METKRSYSDVVKGIDVNKVSIYTVTNVQVHTPVCEEDDTDLDNCCSICYDSLDENSNIATIDCGHKFHYNCIFRWNTKSSGGDSCPLCRKKQDLPEMICSSSEDEESEFESDDSDDENNTISNDIIRCRQKRALQFFLKSNEDTQSDISLNCKTCKTYILVCDFCSNLMCSCKNTDQKITYKVNPFGKLFNCTNNPNDLDEEFYKLFDINTSEIDDEDLRICHTCEGCLKSRDYILWASLIHLDSEYESTHVIIPEVIEHTDIKTVYYNLYSDRSQQDNTILYTTFPSFDTFDRFKDYINEKFTNSNMVNDIIHEPYLVYTYN